MFNSRIKTFDARASQLYQRRDDGMYIADHKIAERPALAVAASSGCNAHQALRIARLTNCFGVSFGIVRDISDHTMTIDIQEAYNPGRRIEVDFGNGQSFVGLVDWHDRTTVMLRFSEQLDPIAILEKTGSSCMGCAGALPRTKKPYTAQASVGDKRVKVAIRSISAAGACLQGDAQIAPGDKVELSIPGLDVPLGAAHRPSERCAGVAFEQQIPIGSLMAWLSSSVDAPGPAR